MMLVGGVLGVLFVIFLRRTLCEDPTLPFPEATAAAEIHKAGQKGATGAKYLFATMGFAGAVELLKNSAGFHLIRDSVSGFVEFPMSKLRFLKQGRPFGEPGDFHGGMHFETPYASPAFMSVGYIIGPRLSALNFSGGVLAWLILVPLIMFISGEGSALMNLMQHPSLADASGLERLEVVADRARGIGGRADRRRRCWCRPAGRSSRCASRSGRRGARLQRRRRGGMAAGRGTTCRYLGGRRDRAPRSNDAPTGGAHRGIGGA
jgi:hypothetical protein